MYHVSYASQAANFLRKAQQKLQKQMKQKIERIAQNPFAPNPSAEKMKGFPHGYRLRVGDYRILFDVSRQTIGVHRIKHRKDAYSP